MTCIHTVITSIIVSTRRIIRTINRTVFWPLFPISLVARTCQYTQSIYEAKEILQSGSNRLGIYGAIGCGRVRGRDGRRSMTCDASLPVTRGSGPPRDSCWSLWRTRWAPIRTPTHRHAGLVNASARARLTLRGFKFYTLLSRPALRGPPPRRISPRRT